MNQTTITQSDLNRLKLQLTLSAKNGVNFIVAASLVWFLVAYVWTLPYSAYNKSVLTFIAGSLLLPLAFLFSKVFKTQWSAKDNPLDLLGLWLNFAQLFYFPILAIILLQEPRLFLVCYVIITGAHLFPYAWFYDEKPYAIFAGIIAVGGMLLNLFLAATEQYLIAVFMGISLGLLSITIFRSYQHKSRRSAKER